MPNTGSECIRAARKEDLPAVAQGLYFTDAYIYPAFCTSPRDEDFLAFLYANADDPTHVFGLDRLLVAETEGRIAGVCCSFGCGEPVEFFRRVPAGREDIYARIDAAYFRPLFEKTAHLSGEYVCNLCVDTDFRGRGIGRRLLGAVFQKTRGDVYLDVLTENSAALHLYRALGFHEEAHYAGFGGPNEREIGCLLMRLRR